MKYVDLSRPGKKRRVSPLGRCIVVVVFFAVLALTLWLWRHYICPPIVSTNSRGDLRGELIADPATNVPGTATGSTKRARYKPGSLPQRLVQFQYRVEKQGLGSNAFSTDLKTANLPPGFVIYTNDVGLKTSLTPDARGYINLGFDFLGGFTFNLEADLAEAGRDPVLAAEKVRAQIPSHIRALDRRRARLRGFLVPVRMEDELTVEFLVMRDQTLCCYGTVPKVNEWVHVRVEGAGVKPVMDIPISVEGVLRVGDRWENGYFAGLYYMEAAKAEFDQRP